MRTLMLVSEYRGRRSVEAAFTESQMEDHGEEWAASIEACREEAASDNPLAIDRYGVVVLDVPDGDIVAAFDRVSA